MRRIALRSSLVAYLALAVGPAALLFPGPEWPLFALGCVVGAVAGVLVGSRIDEPSSLLTLPRVLAGFVLPLAWFVPTVTTATSEVDLFLSPWFAGVCAAGVWLLVTLVAYHYRQQDRIERSTELAAFEARPCPETRRQLRVAVGALLVMTGGAIVIVVALASADVSPSSFVWLPALLPAWISIVLGHDEREIAVTDEGLRVQQTFHDWGTIEGYELTGDAVRFPRRKRFRSDFAFDRDDIDDVDAVVEALETYIDPL